MRITLNELLFSLSRALDSVEQELLGVTTNHGKRAAYTSMRLCQALGFSERDVFDMASCAVLHDNALTTYMLKTGPGSISRLENLKSHCPLGEENASSFPFLGDVGGIILHHHENWNGSGYHHLAGNDIPLRATVLRLADNMDLALRMGDGRAGLLDSIHVHAAKYSGVQYAPLVAQALLDIADREFVDAVIDENIDGVLSMTVPAVGRELSTGQLLQVCRIFAAIIDAKSPFTQNHSAGVAEKARTMAGLYGFDDERCDKLEIAALLHDVGKLSIPLPILEKPGSLSDEEFAVMKGHAATSREILKDIAGLEDLVAWAVNHHEKLDGSGYPLGRSAESLCFESRLVACCDIFQALTEDRPYRAGMEHEKAACIMRNMAGKGELDAGIVEDMLSMPVIARNNIGKN